MLKPRETQVIERHDSTIANTENTRQTTRFVKVRMEKDASIYASCREETEQKVRVHTKGADFALTFESVLYVE